MLVLHRTVGASVLIEDVVFTVDEINNVTVEVCLQKKTGGEPMRVSLPLQQPINICYDTQVVYIARVGERARIGFEAATGIVVIRI